MISISNDASWRSTVLRGHEEEVGSMAISADDTYIVSGSRDDTSRVWKVDNNE